MVKHFQEGPLGPGIVRWFAGTYLPVPVVGKTYFVQLFTVAAYIVFSCNFWCLSGLYGVLFGRQTKGIVTHRMKYVKAFQPFVPRINITGNIAQRMSHVQACPGWIGEHIQNVEFWFGSMDVYFVRFVLCPVCLPFPFNGCEIIFHVCLRF